MEKKITPLFTMIVEGDNEEGVLGKITESRCPSVKPFVGTEYHGSLYHLEREIFVKTYYFAKDENSEMHHFACGCEYVRAKGDDFWGDWHEVLCEEHNTNPDSPEDIPIFSDEIRVELWWKNGKPYAIRLHPKTARAEEFLKFGEPDYCVGPDEPPYPIWGPNWNWKQKVLQIPAHTNLR